MRTLKNIIIGLIVISVILLVISFFLPSKIPIQRSMVIHASRAVVFDQVNDLKKWPAWSPWNRMDPNMRVTYGNISSGTGASYNWSSDKSMVGKGSMKITNSSPNDSIAIAMNFMEQGAAPVSFKFEPADNGTKVTWSMVANMGWNPIGKFFGLAMMDKMVGSSFEKGLKNIDSVVASIKPIQPLPPDSTKNSARDSD